MDDTVVYINSSEVFSYPKKDEFFNPSTSYPEYQYPNDIAKIPNPVYGMVRESLYHLNLDGDNYGKKAWNPLSKMIEKGNIVLIKPNMVLDQNMNGTGLDCLITHPSLVRAVIDYVVKALDGTGTIIVGDAPVQSCNFEHLTESTGYSKIIEFYERKGLNIELIDFRNYKSRYKSGNLKPVKQERINESILVDLGNESEFFDLPEERFNNLRITNYDHTIMKEHHNSKKKEYLIAKKVLEADVIINMPKPKTHQKAGVTISLKNMIGINTNKEWLPHHTKGSVTEGGDEYQNKSMIKRIRSEIEERRNLLIPQNKRKKAKMYSTLIRGLTFLGNLSFKDKYSEGSWYRNDTIWRTILDINRIIFYADKDSNMMDKKQRKMLIIADMIISGEGEGPLTPTPKKVGIVAAGVNPVCFDMTISKIMGFDYQYIPSINNANKNSCKYPIGFTNDLLILSNKEIWNKKQIDQIEKEHSLRFKPNSGWFILSEK